MKKKLSADLVVIGGGASGLVAAICAARKNKGKKVVILEVQDRVGKKILVTGNGRCNLLNQNISLENYNFDAHNFLKPLLEKYSHDKILKFFNSMGLVTKVDSEGRVYPFCGQASAVLDILRLECKRLNVSEICGVNLEEVLLNEALGNRFTLCSRDLAISTKSVIFSTGGATFFDFRIYKNTYNILTNLGHTYKKTFPALVSVLTETGFESYLKGIRAAAKVKLLADESLIKEETGEVQFTDKGISGICIFQISRLVSEFLNLKTINGKKHRDVLISIDLLPHLDLGQVVDLLLSRVLRFGFESVDYLFSGVINKKFLIPILKASNISYKNRKLDSMKEREIIKISKTIKNFEFIPFSTMPLKNAQVMSGGVNLSEVNNLTLESLRVKNLYLTGELLNIDGNCGGYNLYWAWASGMIAGNSVNL